MKVWNRITFVSAALLLLYGIVWSIGYVHGRADGGFRREATAFLTETMPALDRDTLPAKILRENVKYALRAREEFPWAAALPDSIFLNEVLPYAVVDEPRESWRPRFYEMFAPKVRGLQTIEEAIAAVNRDINLATGVEYDVRRARTNQSPSESMAQGMASCTGLSIILVDAFRSVGIPARFAGTAAWWDDRGNHSWVEVWVDGEWRFTEFYPDPVGLDNAWFLPDAGRSQVWATSWRETGAAFPMVWSEGSAEVHGVDVTDRYRERWMAVRDRNAASGDYVDVRVVAFDAGSTTSPLRGTPPSQGGEFSLLDKDGWTPQADGVVDARLAVNVDVFSADGVQLGGGRTSGPRDDAQRFLTFQLPRHTEIELRWSDENGNAASKTVLVGGENQTVEIN